MEYSIGSGVSLQLHAFALNLRVMMEDIRYLTCRKCLNKRSRMTILMYLDMASSTKPLISFPFHVFDGMVFGEE